MASLQDLDLRGDELTDITPLAGMASLRRLNLRDTEISSLVPIAPLIENGLVVRGYLE